MKKEIKKILLEIFPFKTNFKKKFLRLLCFILLFISLFVPINCQIQTFQINEKEVNSEYCLNLNPKTIIIANFIGEEDSEKEIIFGTFDSKLPEFTPGFMTTN